MNTILRAGVSAVVLGAAVSAQAIEGGTATSSFEHVGHGVQITEAWVLTARHVAGLDAGSTYFNGWGSATIASRYELGSGDFPLHDLALLRLATSITAPALDLLATAMSPGLLASPLPVTLASGSNQSPRGFAHIELREVIDQIDPDDDGPKPAVPVQWLLSYGSSSVPYVQSGDSGGGLFFGTVADSTGALLMGISSAQLQFDDGGFGSAFVQLASYRNWIDSTMAGDLADAQLVRWVPTPVPEPASWALALAGGLLLSAVAQRRRR